MKNDIDDSVVLTRPPTTQKHRSKLDEIAAAMYRAYENGMSLKKVEELYRARVKKSTIRQYFTIRGYALRPRGKHYNLNPRIEYGGKTYSLSKRGQWKATSHRAGERYVLERAIWLDTYGSIPEGMYVGHKDGDRTNHAIENLFLKKSARQKYDPNP